MLGTGSLIFADTIIYIYVKTISKTFHFGPKVAVLVVIQLDHFSLKVDDTPNGRSPRKD